MKPLISHCDSILPCSNTYSQSLNCKQISRSNTLTKQYFITFCLQERLGSTYFPKEYLFAWKIRLPGKSISQKIMTEKLIFPCKQVLGSYFLTKYIFRVIPERSGTTPKQMEYNYKISFFKKKIIFSKNTNRSVN